MGVQKVVNQRLALGIAGEFLDDAPRAAKTYILAANEDALPEYGKVFTLNESGQAQPGGEGEYLGILVNPKTAISYNGLESGLTVPAGSNGAIAYKGNVIVKSITAAVEGNLAIFNKTTGEISAIAKDGDIPGTHLLVPNAVFAFYEGAAGETAVLSLNGRDSIKPVE
jgi:hypothetical protein